MPPNADQKAFHLQEEEKILKKNITTKDESVKNNIIYVRVIIFGYFHFAALYGLYLSFTSGGPKWPTILFGYMLYLASEFGIAAGNHRLWSHRSYKARLPLEAMLLVFSSLAGQFSICNWVRDHRMHHKYSDTDADPHNASRGFFFSHIGWLLMKKHKDIKAKGKNIDTTDIYNNPLLRFQDRYAFLVLLVFCYVLPTAVPMICWGESFTNAWHINMLRFVGVLNMAFSVNSAGHMLGYKPYDKNILPASSKFMSLLTMGEGFHNFHHTFPCDYRSAELGNDRLNLTTKIIDFFAWVGWAYDLKAAPRHIIAARAERTGDGTDKWGKK